MAKRLPTLLRLKEATGETWQGLAVKAGLSPNTLLRKEFLLSPESGVKLARTLADLVGEGLDEIIPPLSPEDERAARILYTLFVEQLEDRERARAGRLEVARS